MSQHNTAKHMFIWVRLLLYAYKHTFDTVWFCSFRPSNNLYVYTVITIKALTTFYPINEHNVREILKKENVQISPAWSYTPHEDKIERVDE